MKSKYYVSRHNPDKGQSRFALHRGTPSRSADGPAMSGTIESGTVISSTSVAHGLGSVQFSMHPCWISKAIKAMDGKQRMGQLRLEVAGKCETG